MNFSAPWVARRVPRTAFVAGIALILFVGGCMARELLNGGEGFSIGVTNVSDQEIESIYYEDSRLYSLKYANTAAGGGGQRPWKGKRPAMGGYPTMQDNGKKVPEQLTVSWRDAPERGQPSYTGKLNGPYTVDIRSRIPAEVLSQAKKEGFMVEISLEIANGPILVNWQLTESKYNKPGDHNSGHQTIVHRQDGDSFK
jgi:hypothetical protein